MTEFNFWILFAVPFFQCTQAFSQHFSKRNCRVLTLSFTQRLFQLWPPKRAHAISACLKLHRDHSRKPGSVCNRSQWRARSATLSLFPCTASRREAKFCDGGDLCEKPTNSRPKPSSLSSRTRRGHRHRLETNLHWSAHPSVVYGVYLQRFSTANQL